MKAVYLLTGPNQTFKEQYLAKLIQGIDPADVTTYYPEDTDIEVLFDQCYQNTLFGTANVVLVKRVEAIKDKSKKDTFKKTLENYLDQLNPDTTLIVDWEKLPAALEKKVKDNKAIEVKEFKKIYKTESLTAYIREELAARKIEIDSSALDLIIQLSNSDLEQIAAFTRLLAEGASPGVKLGYAEVRRDLSRAHNLSVFDLIDSLFNRDLEASLNALEDLRLAGESVIGINNMLLRTSRLLWAILAEPNDPDLYGRLSISPFEFKKLKGMAPRVPMRYLSRVLELVARVEVISKTTPEEFSWLELEAFVLSWKTA